MVGDVAGAVVEGESPSWIREAYPTVDAMLAAGDVPEPFGVRWTAGRYTDDTQMSICVAEWLLHDRPVDGAENDPEAGRRLLERFAAAFEPWRRYGPATLAVLERFPAAGDAWRDLARAQFPEGSWGNGSAMRAAPVGLRFHGAPDALVLASRTASVTTHAHPLAVCGATLQATAVAAALRVKDPRDAPLRILDELKDALAQLRTLGRAHSVYSMALSFVGRYLEQGASPAQAARTLGTGIAVHEAVPTALYCFLANADSFEGAVSEAVRLGGDTDTIASMAGAISGALLGERAIPDRWLAGVKEEAYSVERVRGLADRLLDAATGDPA
jgi:poly(ADP-ribose) glycohydrolase ARH3